MIAVDGKELSSLPAEHPFWPLYKQAINALKSRAVKRGDDFVFVFPPDKITPPDPRDENSREETSQGDKMRATQAYITDGFSVEVTYFKSKVNTEKGPRYGPRYIDFNEKLAINIKKDLDLLYWYLIISPHTLVLNEFAEYQNQRRAYTPAYVLEDKLVSAQAVLAIEELIHEARSLIFGKNSMDLEKLRKVAGNMGIPGAADTDPTILKTKLNNLILKKDIHGRTDVKKVQAFIDSGSGGKKKTEPTVDVGAIIQDALDKNVIVMLKKDSAAGRPKQAWHLTDEKGEPVKMIRTWMGGVAVDRIKETIENNPEIIGLIRERLGDS